MARPQVTLTALTALPQDERKPDLPDEDVEVQTQADPRLLGTTTGGLEYSCHSCLLAFGLVTTLIGIVTTGVAYTRDSHGSVIATLGLVLLGSGLTSVALSCMWRRCWKKGRRRRKESFSMLVCEEQEKKMTV
ncbi:transmembrane protein 100 [Microcaecilia unicolor]|uniref:Transmembrane protein 100-like n=1 Tax=Microcaecilia unicolor TaxID=1415580 RepID=A0A6P7XDJ1_9AMPH|nr:transmembrane protein 100-like [Microcaecilia unicolor]XP_030053610.1 transmembrane protein 100-like [Microcaecilia unicolor]XP_030053611.1 transmembrane protein 100-like [Microcaecilia unicolor]XP_030053612.1 transmembrane protein 100-like [Microcaecilia unicolor]